MRPTWNAETIVDPFEKVSGSTSVLWLVVLVAAHVACVNGSVLMCVVAAPAAAGNPRAAATARTDKWLDMGGHYLPTQAGQFQIRDRRGFSRDPGSFGHSPAA